MRNLATGAVLGALLCVWTAAAQADGDPARGEKVYERCEGCHSIDRDRIGPRHKGVVGRRAASIDGFAYSPAMKNSGLTWDEATLDRFLQGPTKLVPGTRMGFAGVPVEQDRADLIAFLRKAGG
ncbi:MAG: cytochrome c family protein [Alphaproteobacteria bacterium]|nr:cytochrome c family protein [Alphaproteobacteria bacterium]